MATKIVLKDGSELHLAKDVSFPCNMKVSDIRDFSKRTGSYSNAVEIAGTKNNIKVLSFLFDVNTYDASFNIRRKVKCQVIQNGVQVFSKLAFFQLRKVVKSSKSHTTDTDEVKFYGLVFNTVSNFSSIIKGRNVDDLHISDPSDIHTLNRANIVSSFSHDVNDKYCYPVYYKPAFMYNGVLTNETVYNVSDFKPAIFLKTIWDAIHSEAGFSYEWASLTDNDFRFDKLITNYNKKYEPSAQETLEHSIEIGTDLNPDPDESSPAVENAGTITFPEFVGLNDNNALKVLNNNNFLTILNTAPLQTINAPTAGLFFPNNVASYMKTISNIVRDDKSQYDNSNGQMTPILQGQYDIEFTIDFKVQFNVSEDCEIVFPVGNDNFLLAAFKPFVRIEPEAVGSGSSWNRYEIAGETIPVVINDGDVSASLTSGDNQMASGTYKGICTLDVDPDSGEVIDSFGVALEVTQKPSYQNNGSQQMNIVVINTAQTAYVNITPKIEIDSVNIKIKPRINYQEGLTIDIDRFLPTEWSQAQFVKDVMVMYNLMAVPDEEDENKIIYIGRDEYYDSGNEHNFSQLLDESREKEIEFLPDLKNKVLQLGYSEGKDKVNEVYQNVTGRTFGDQIVKFDSDFTTGVEKKLITPCPTPVRPMKGFGGYAPMIDVEEPESTPRILYWIGAVDNDWISIRDRDGTVVQPGTYGMAHHSDDHLNPSFDINFGTALYYFYPEYKFTINNLFNLHYRRVVQQINDGKLMRAWFKLDELTVSKIRLNDRIYIDNSWWTINELKFDANKDKIVKIELISLDPGASIKPRINWGSTGEAEGTETRYPGDFGGAPGGGSATTTGEIETQIRSQVDGGDGRSGSGNTYGGNNDGTKVKGSNNVIQNGVRDAFVQGDSNKVSRSKTMIVGDNMAINEDGIHAFLFNVHGQIKYPNRINGVDYEMRKYSINLDREDIQNLNSVPILITSDDLGHGSDSVAYPVLVEVEVDDDSTAFTGNVNVQLGTVVIINRLSSTKIIITDNLNDAQEVSLNNDLEITATADPGGGGVNAYITIDIYYRIKRNSSITITSS